MENVDLGLIVTINQILSDFSDDSKHYLVVANYYFHNDRLHHFSPVYFHEDSVDDISFEDNGVRCKLVFEQCEDYCSIIIPYDEIGKISMCSEADFTIEEILFHNEEVMLKYQRLPQKVLARK